MELILVRHALPAVDPAVPAVEWDLGDDGRRSCGALADLLALYEPRVVVTSRERKAVETGRLIADALGLRREEEDGLHDHDRRDTGWLEQGRFLAAMEALFAHPSRVVFGLESAVAAHARFTSALNRVERLNPTGTLVVVTHGTVMSLFGAGGDASDAHVIWKRLGFPALMVFERPSRRLAHMIEQI
jgi:broad specificity phosphatase PhoE